MGSSSYDSRYLVAMHLPAYSELSAPSRVASSLIDDSWRALELLSVARMLRLCACVLRHERLRTSSSCICHPAPCQKWYNGPMSDETVEQARSKTTVLLLLLSYSSCILSLNSSSGAFF